MISTGRGKPGPRPYDDNDDYDHSVDDGDDEDHSLDDDGDNGDDCDIL